MNEKDKSSAPASPANSSNKDNSLLAAGTALGAVKHHPGFNPVVIVPEGYLARELTLQPLKPLPDHIRQRVRLDDADSFITYVKGFRTHTTRIFGAAVNIAKVGPGNAGGAKFTALLDYHEGGKDQKAARVAHVAEYPVPLSLEFSTWLGKNGQGQAQVDFINFVEANGADVVSPDSASLVELALNFESKSNVTFQAKIDRTKGGKVLNFTEQVDAGAPSVGQVTVPEFLSLSLPVFEGGKRYPLSARMEYRASNGRLTITYHLQRPHEAFRLAMTELRQEIATSLDTEILTGEAVGARVAGSDDYAVA